MTRRCESSAVSKVKHLGRPDVRTIIGSPFTKLRIATSAKGRRVTMVIDEYESRSVWCVFAFPPPAMLRPLDLAFIGRWEETRSGGANLKLKL